MRVLTRAVVGVGIEERVEIGISVLASLACLLRLLLAHGEGRVGERRRSWLRRLRPGAAKSGGEHRQECGRQGGLIVERRERGRVGYKVRKNRLNRVVDGDDDGEGRTDQERAVVGMVQSSLVGCTLPDRRDGHSHLYLVCPLFAAPNTFAYRPRTS